MKRREKALSLISNQVNPADPKARLAFSSTSGDWRFQRVRRSPSESCLAQPFSLSFLPAVADKRSLSSKLGAHLVAIHMDVCFIFPWQEGLRFVSVVGPVRLEVALLCLCRPSDGHPDDWPRAAALRHHHGPLHHSAAPAQLPHGPLQPADADREHAGARYRVHGWGAVPTAATNVAAKIHSVGD